MKTFIEVFYFVICSLLICVSWEESRTKNAATNLLAPIQKSKDNFWEKNSYFWDPVEDFPSVGRPEVTSKTKRDEKEGEGYPPIDDEDTKRESSGSGEKYRKMSAIGYIQSDESQANSSATNSTSSNSPDGKLNSTKATALIPRVKLSTNASTPTSNTPSLQNNTTALITSTAAAGLSSNVTQQPTHSTKARQTTSVIVKSSVRLPVLFTVTAASVFTSSSSVLVSAVRPTGLITTRSKTIATTKGKSSDHDVKNQIEPMPNEKERKTLFGFVTVEILVALLAGAACAIILLVFLVHRLKKRNEGSYELQESLSLKAGGYDEKEVFV